VTNSVPTLLPSAPGPATIPPPSCFIDPHGEDLIRRDLHGPEHLEALARQLAEMSILAPPGQRSQPLLPHFAQTGRQLKQAHRQIQEATRRQERLGPATEWLLDNFHIIEESLRDVRRDLPHG